MWHYFFISCFKNNESQCIEYLTDSSIFPYERQYVADRILAFHTMKSTHNLLDISEYAVCNEYLITIHPHATLSLKSGVADINVFVPKSASQNPVNMLILAFREMSVFRAD